MCFLGASCPSIVLHGKAKAESQKLKQLTEEADEPTGQSSSKSGPSVGVATLNAQKKSAK